MRFRWIPAGSLVLLPGFVSAMVGADIRNPFYLTALALAGLEGAIHGRSLFLSPGDSLVRRLVGFMVAVGSGHLMANTVYGTLCVPSQNPGPRHGA